MYEMGDFLQSGQGIQEPALGHRSGGGGRGGVGGRDRHWKRGV